MGFFFYVNDFWVKDKIDCGIFCVNVGRSIEIEEDNCCLLRCLD